MKLLVTGSAGFIGSHLCMRLLQTESPVQIVGIDSLNDYYDPDLKRWRMKQIESVAETQPESSYRFIKGSIADNNLIDSLFEQERFDIVVNLAAQAGVRYSIDNPDVYIQSNIIGFYNILESCRHHPVKHLVYASSSSVYGGNDKIPFSENDKVDTPVSLYAATKKSDELIAHAYHHLYGIPCTGLRFFTVYGPAGRPDMAYYDFTDKLVKGDHIKLFNFGNCKRDFTYIDDIIEGILRVIRKPQGYALYNIGNSFPVNVLDFVHILHEELIKSSVLPADFNLESHLDLVPMQSGDVVTTYADTSALERDFGYKPSVTLRAGLSAFARWYKNYASHSRNFYYLYPNKKHY